jgi:hypothetical protein
MRWVAKVLNFVILILGLIAAVIGIFWAVQTSYPQVEMNSGGINTPFEFTISDSGFFCLYDVKPLCADLNLGLNSGLNLILPPAKHICPSEQALRFSCQIKGPPATTGSRVILKLQYSLYPVWIRLIKLTKDASLGCELGDTGRWSCGNPM